MQFHFWEMLNNASGYRSFDDCDTVLFKMILMMCFISLDYDITAASAMGTKGFLGAYRQVRLWHMLNPIICYSATSYLHQTFFGVNKSEEVHQ